ncbi:unnamed protein product [Dibothriocephalus latus]|uniref:Uncharacterized protein n=1 Tax=Dibothriocephalus latus TaxID=60516 RepID=A0A3P7LK68_DIBLA|nr:unnamed protein product [Dibothriocephalus latus]
MYDLAENPVNDLVKQNGRKGTALSDTRPDIERLTEIFVDQKSCGGRPIVGLNHGNDFGPHSIQIHYSPQGLTMDGIECSGKVDESKRPSVAGSNGGILECVSV